MKKFLYFSGIVASSLVLSFLDTQKAVAQWSGSAGIPVATWDFELNSARTTGETAVDQAVSAGCTFDGKFGSTTTTTTVAGAGADYGTTFTYPGATAGSAISATGWDIGANPGIAATNYYQFTVNTHGFNGIQMTFDYQASGAAPTVGVNYSLDGGSTWVNLAATSSFGSIGSWIAGTLYNFPTGANNLNNLMVRIYGYHATLGTGTLALDNLEFYGGGTVAAVGLIGTTLNENQVFTGNLSGSTGFMWARNGFALNGANTELVINNSGINITSGTTFAVASQGTVTLGNGGAITGNGGFSVASGSTIKTANTAGITASGSGGSITTTGRSFSPGANYVYNGTAAQVTGDGLPSAMVSPGSVSVWNISGVSLSAATSFASGSGINLVAGNFGGAATTLNAGAFIQRDNGSFSTSPVLSGAINVTYANLGVNALSTTTGSELPASASGLNNLTINKSGATINLNTDITVNGSLALTVGYLSLGSNNLLLPYSATVTGTPSAANMVVATGAGMLKRGYIANASFQYPIGDGTNYTPITLNFTSGSFNAGANAGVNVVAMKHPSNANTTNYLNRYWNVAVANMTSPVYAVTSAQYVTADVTGTESAIAGGSYAGALPWIKFAAANTVSHTISSTAVITSNTSFSGISLAGPTVTVSAPSGVCTGGSVNISVISSTGDGPLTFTWSPASSLSTFTGTSVTASPTSSTVYTVTVTDANGLTGSATSSVTVLTAPSVIAGTPTVCTGLVTTLSSSPSGGAWSSDNIAVASVGSATGYVTGLSAGTANITYLLPSGCYQSEIVTVNTTPAPISGSSNVCKGSTATFTDATPSGIWGTSNVSVASVSSAGVVTGVAIGAATISYTLPSGCRATMAVTVDQSPSAINGTTTVCLGGVTTLSDATGTGSWSSGDITVATVGSGTGVVSTVAAGTANITYTLPDGCGVSTTVTINSLPTGITGTAVICAGNTTTLANATTGGSWISSATSVATVGTGNGVVTGIASGTATITYKLLSGCYITTVVTVNGLPANVLGTGSVCVGEQLTLTDATGGGTWTSASTSIATVGTSSGIVTGVAGGNSVISYMLPTGCYRTTTVTINALPATIAGPGAVCVGSVITLTDATTGGTWSSSNTAVANAGIATGFITGSSAGVTTITYRASGTSCYVTTNVTVNALPAAISGTAVMCLGNNTTLTDATTGGTWASANSAVATIGVSSGIVSSVAAGTSTITYTDGNGCYKTTSVTVNALPGAISGTFTVCAGNTVNLAGSGGGSWSSSNTSVATIGSSSGVVTGVAAGTSAMTYTLATGCYTTAVVTVNPLPAAISGTLAFCSGSSTTLSDASVGGTWYSANTSVAAIGSSTGIVTSSSNGVAAITYTLPTGCKTSVSVTVNLLPGTISGTTTLCEGTTVTLSAATSGGTWTSSNATIASVSSSGVVNGIAAGIANISYSLSSGCYRTLTITVNAAPATITGPATMCTGLTSTYSNAAPGGNWSSLSSSVATIDPLTGIATGVNAGSNIISYTLPNGCKTSMAISVNPSPAAFTGSASVCVGAITTLSSASPGGAWSSSNTAVGTIGVGTGIVYGISAGTTVISYTMPTGCYNFTIATVNPLPAPIAGPSTVCIGSTAALTDASVGGTWASSATAVATVNGTTGVVTGVASGTARITYKLATGCQDTAVITVNSLPSAITGTGVVCLGGTTTLADATTGGVWSSVTPSVATIDPSTGIVSTVSAGTATISYTISTGCAKTMVVTVNPLPLPIAGTTEFCVGTTSTLTDATPTGTWSSSNATIVSINASTGIATGIASGSAVIVYKLSTGCLITTGVTIDPLPAAITGAMGVCIGSVSTLADATTGGNWSSSNTSVASVGTAGDVNGLTVGTATISYTLPTGCFKTTTVTVNPLPAAISGTMELCATATTTLTDATTGGTWTSGSTSVATIGIANGIVSAVAAGNSVITYKITATGCITTAIVTVDPLPAAISGPSGVCLGMTGTLSDAAAGGTWVSSNSLVATIDAAGVITGVATGTTLISYILPTGCQITKAITVNPLPSAITGTMVVCEGSSTTLADPTAGGTWSTANAIIAGVSTAGIVNGVNAGNVNITYMLSTGCYAVANVTVNPTPTAITGAGTVCNGATTTLGDALTGGTWISSNVLVATIGTSDGIVTGISNGTATVTYMLPTGCKNTKVVTVNPLPPAITGAATVCIGYATTLTDPIGGGTWSSSDGTIATATTASPSAVTGMGAGIATITYTLSTGCYNTIDVTVNPTPPTISGNLNVCVGGTTSLSNTMTGGSWGTSNAAIATVGLSTGVVSGIAAGATNVTYTMVTGCRAISQVTVNALPLAISGPSAVCIGLSATMTDASVGGTWSSSDMTVATVGSGSGLVVGVSAGTTVISYTQATGCSSTKLISVVPVPAPITGTTTLCVGTTSLLSDANVGGTWTSSNPSVAAVNYSTGVVTGMVAGVANITYTLSTGCNSITTVTINPTPVNITGSSQVCLGSSITLNDASFGGTWSSSNPGIASVDAAGGVVTGLTTGATIISYTNSFGCYKTTVVSVNPLPPAISGSPLICFGSTTTLSDGVAGGTWSSTNTSVATINSVGVVTSVSTGTSTISYAIAPTGCAATVDVTVNPLPSPVVGTTAVCIGSSTTLTNAVTGGNWSSGSVSVASVGSSTGIVTGISAGTTVITYSLGTGCRVTAIVTVNTLPAAITGPGSLCAGATISLTDASPIGSWTSSNLSVATINTSGLLSGISAGIATISYTAPSGCYRTTDVTVNPVPSTISGTTNACVGNTTTLGNTVTGGIWTSSNPSIASIDVTSGIVTGNAAGTALITYTLGTGCRNSIAVTINTNPGAIAGITTLCEGSLVTLSDPVATGTWSSNNSGIANIGISTGIINGVAAGITTITYTLPGGCYTTTNVTVNPAPPAILGNAGPICVGGTATFTEAIPGGTWTSSNAVIATAGLSSGVVTGVSDGTATITYTLAAGCNVTTKVTVNAAPGPITGVSVICIGGNTTLGNAQSGGTWSSSDGSIATIDFLTGIVTGVSSGVVHITYVLGASGCEVTSSLTVNPAPSSITGNSTVCVAGADTLSDATPGGIWSSSNTSILSINLSSGVAVAVASGTATVSYSIVGTGCVVTKTITVNPLPAPITGIAYVCVSATTTLANDSISGYWSSSNLSMATVGSSTGIVTGLNPGLDTIIYTLPTGCSSKLTIQVNALPADIIGDSVMCVGTAKTLSNATAYGIWSTSNAAVAIVSATSAPTTVPSTAAVTGVTSGVVFISYTLGTGCTMAKLVTVNPSPAPIEGDSAVCQGAIDFLYNAVAGGTWSSSNTSIATVSPTGDIIGGNVGTVTISYLLPTGCYATKNIVVNATPSDIFTASGGPMSLCQNATLALADTLSGGVWSTSGGIATVNASTGVVTGVSAGATYVTYTSVAGCLKAGIVTVFPSPDPITGTPLVCAGSTITLADPTSGGAWSSLNASLATVDTSGIVTGILAGIDTIRYTSPTGCYAYVSLTVNPLPTAGVISGSSFVCLGSSITLSDTVPGGVWSSSDAAVASIVDTSGIATGVSAGTVTITYTVTTMCGTATQTAILIVNPLPDAGTITGSHFICKDHTITLSSTVAGGTWSTSNTTYATVSTSGVVSGIAAGVDTVMYSITTVCGTDVAKFTVTVNALAPHTNITIHPDTMMCSNTLFQNFGVDSSAPAGLSYTWSAENAQVFAVSANGQNALVSFPTAGTAVVRLTTDVVASGCGVVDSFVATIGTSVSANPEVKYYGSELICTDNTSDSYTWGYDDVNTLDSNVILGQIHQDYYLPVPDFSNKSYWVITRHGDCYQKSYYNIPTSAVGTYTMNDISIKLFPNPASSSLNIEVKGLTNTNNLMVRVTDMLGKDIQATALDNGKGMIGVSDLAPGLYTVTIVQDGVKIGSKIFVKN